MAEGLAKKIFGDKVHIYSAGSQPNGKVHSLAIQVMKEIGIDIFNHTSQSYDSLPYDVRTSLDYVITLCVEESCPVFGSRARKFHWPLPDSAAISKIEDNQLKTFRKVRDEIQKRLERFKETLF